MPEKSLAWPTLLTLATGGLVDNVWIFFSKDLQECANKVQAPGDKDLNRGLVAQRGNNRNGLFDGWDYVQNRGSGYLIDPCSCKLLLNRELF